MSELDSIKLNPESQLLLEVATIRLPYELSRRNLKQAQKHIEKERENVLSALKTLTGASAKGQLTKEKALATIDHMIARMTILKKKLEEIEEERKRLLSQSEARIAHVAELWKIPTVADVKYEAWSRIRLDRLLVDYMLRKGHTEAARLLAEEKGIEKLVDIELFTVADKIATALRGGSLTEALAWCSEHKPLMKNMKASPSNPNLRGGAGAGAAAAAAAQEAAAKAARDRGPLTAPPPSATSLDFQLRLQQCINLLNPPANSPNATRDVAAARAHMAKYISPHLSDPAHQTDVRAVATLLVLRPEVAPASHRDYYSDGRWGMLAELFTATFLELWGLPREAGLKRALQAGLTALKTPSCHPAHMEVTPAAAGTAPMTDDDMQQDNGVAAGDKVSTAGASTASPPVAGTMPGTRLCPICSAELNALAKDLPYAHHSQSLVDPDPVVLPNDRIYGRQKLKDFAEKMGVQEGTIKDPVTGEEFDARLMRKVFIM